MKRIRYHRYRGPQELRVADVERPSPTKGVLVRVVASADPMDWRFRRSDATLFNGCLATIARQPERKLIIEPAGGAA